MKYNHAGQSTVTLSQSFDVNLQRQSLTKTISNKHGSQYQQDDGVSLLQHQEFRILQSKNSLCEARFDHVMHVVYIY